MAQVCHSGSHVAMVDGWIGKTVSHFEITGKLGAGGMGVVYRAKDVRLGRLVALKFLGPHLLDSPAALERFEREARALSALSHPNIAVLYDIGRDEQGQPYLVLEHLPGGSLRARVKGRRVPWEEIRSYARQMGNGLQHAHAHGIVHRDVKPANALFAADGMLKLSDFGLARLRDLTEVTGEGGLAGTMAYMAPELFRGAAADHRADIYSFGVVLYELAAGALPFRAETAEGLIHQVLTAEPPPVSEVRPDLPAHFERVVSRALSKVPEERYQSIQELVNDLAPGEAQDVLAVRSTVTIPSTASRVSGERLTLWDRWRWMAAVAALSLLAALVAARWTPVISGLGGPHVPAHKQLIVLPFENIGANPDNQAFCDGLLETLTSTLSTTEAFQQSFWVVPASEVRRNATRSIQDAQRTYGINLAITGSVYRTGGDVQVTVNLADAKTMRQLASRVIPYRRDDLTRLQTTLAGAVLELLELQMQPRAAQSVQASGTANSRAYDWYLEGQGFLRRFDGPPSLDKAIPVLEKAVQADAGFALARSALAEAYYRRYEQTKDTVWLARADDEAGRAAAIDDRFPQVHTTLGSIARGTGRYDTAVAEFRRSLSLDPANSEALRLLARTLEDMNRPQDAEAAFLNAFRQKPSYWPTSRSLGLFYFNHGRYADAERYWKLVTSLAPTNPSGYLNLGALYYAMKRYDEAVAVLNQSIKLTPVSEAYTNLGTIQFLQGRYSEAVISFEKAVELAPKDAYMSGNLADAYREAAGQRAKADETYATAIDLARQQLSVNPNNANLRSSMAVYLAKTGKRAEALAEIARALSLGSNNVNIVFKAAIVHEVAGDRPAAIRYLRDAIARGYSPDEVQHLPEFADLRRDSGVQQLLSQAGKR